MDIDDHFEFVYANEGDFAYFCTVHSMMTGVVHVRKAAVKLPATSKLSPRPLSGAYFQ